MKKKFKKDIDTFLGSFRSYEFRNKGENGWFKNERLGRIELYQLDRSTPSAWIDFAIFYSVKDPERAFKEFEERCKNPSYHWWEK